MRSSPAAFPELRMRTFFSAGDSATAARLGVGRSGAGTPPDPGGCTGAGTCLLARRRSTRTRRRRARGVRRWGTAPRPVEGAPGRLPEQRRVPFGGLRWPRIRVPRHACVLARCHRDVGVLLRRRCWGGWSLPVPGSLLLLLLLLLLRQLLVTLPQALGAELRSLAVRAGGRLADPGRPGEPTLALLAGHRDAHGDLQLMGRPESAGTSRLRLVRGAGFSTHAVTRPIISRSTAVRLSRYGSP